MANFDDEFDSAPDATFDDEFDKAPEVQSVDDTFADVPTESKMSSEAASGIGAVAGGLAAEGARQAAGSDLIKGWAEDLAYRGIGGRSTTEGKKLYTDSLAKLTDPDMVNITPRSIGRQSLDEGILGTFGMASPEEQLVKQRKLSQSKMADKTNFLAPLDQPGAIDRQQLLAEYERLAGIQDLNPTLAIDKQKEKLFQKSAPDFNGFESITGNEAAKAQLQARVNYEGTAKESAQQALDKAQAEARRLTSEQAVKASGGQAALDEFMKLKQRSGNASVAEKIIAKNALTDGVNPGTINKLSKFMGEVILEKAPAMGAKALDTLGKMANSKPARTLIPLAGTIGGLATGNLSQAAEEAPGDIPVLGQAYEAIRSEDAGSVEDDMTMIAERNAAVNYKNSPGGQAKRQMTDFLSQDPESLKQLATVLESSGNTYAAPLMKAAEADDRTRSAVLFGLYQQPAFRSLIDGQNGTLKTDIPGVKKSDK